MLNNILKAITKTIINSTIEVHRNPNGLSIKATSFGILVVAALSLTLLS